MLDILIRDGWVADGTGNPPYPADVAIQRDTIVDVRPLPGAQAALVIDALGKIVCPGFVDGHSHSDWSIHANPTAESTIRQGITTEIVGQCGLSNAPLTPLSHPTVVGRLRTYGYDGPTPWSSSAEYLDFVAGMGTSCNLAFFVGHNTVRAAAGVSGPQATEEQLAAMEDFVREAMEAGALGLTTGLEFEPGRTAPAAEVQRLVDVVGRYGGWYGSHIRNRDAHLEEAVQEFLTTASRAGVKGQVSHLSVRHNTGAAEGAWERAVASIERSRRQGLPVLADTTPYHDGIGVMQAILPPWLLAEGAERAAALLRDPAVRQRLRSECDRYWRFIHRGEWERVRLLSSNAFPEVCGKTFPEIAEQWGKDPWECYFDILAAEGAQMESALLSARLFTDEHLAQMVGHPLFFLEVDNFTTRVDGPLAERSRHPHGYGGMVHYLTYHVREKHTLRLEEAIRKMTSMPAAHHGLSDRGLLRRGGKADVVVFDYEALEEASTLERPHAYARGVEHVVVNGTPVVHNGEHTGARPGRVLRRS